MTTKVSREQAFSVLATNFSISPSESGYTLQISADGINFTDLFAVGANVTRMVTGVASGSYYKLRGNTDTDVIINWQSQCNDGQGGGGGVGPQGPQGPQGATGAQGPAGEGGSGEGVVYVSHLSDTEAVEAPVGTLVVVNNEDDSFADVKWDNSTRKFTMDYNSLDEDFKLGIWNYYDTYFTLFSTVNNEFYIRASRTGNADVDYPLSGASGTVVMNNMAGRTIAAAYTNDEGHFEMQFNQNTTNTFLGGFAKNIEHNIYIKVNGGEVASWNGYKDIYQTAPMSIIYDDLDDFLNFTDGKALFRFKYRYSGANRFAVVDKNEMAIILYNDSEFTDEVARANYLGEEIKFQTQATNNQGINIQWKEDEITLRFSEYIELRELIDFHIDGVHYHRITDPTKANASNLGITDAQTGFPLWNNEGIIIGRDSEKKTKGVQINYGANSYSNMTNVVCTSGENYMPSRMYVPTAAGTQGQVLTFVDMNSAPVWATIIKAQQITSAAYEALATKDPNTLYLIIN